MDGIMRPNRKNTELTALLKKALGPSPQTGMTLEDHLAELDEQTLQHLMQVARLVKMAMNMQQQPISYHDLAKRMYPKLGHYKLAMIGEMLQQADPITLPVVSAPHSPREEHTAPPADKRQMLEDMLSEATDGRIAPLTPASDTRQLDFLDKLAMSESSGKTDAEITLQDGRRYVGKYQFGTQRLSDYKQATGERFTQDDFKADASLQERVAAWHFDDLNKVIDALGDAATGYDREGLLAVAHLGGASGMKRFVKTRGAYNPSDELGTSLSDYYSKFSSKQS